MKTVVKTALVFVGGAIAGSAWEKNKKRVARAIGDKLAEKIFEDEPRRRAPYVSYYYDRDNMGRRVSYRSYHPEFPEFVFATRASVENTLDEVRELIDDNGHITVADYMELIFQGDQIKSVHHEWGWTNVYSARVIRVRDGYELHLPRPVHIEKYKEK